MELHNRIAIPFLLIFLIGITSTTSCVQEKSASKEGSVASQDLPKAPVFQAKNLVDNKDISLEDLKGHVLIINFWATWCPPCRMEIPGFIELHNKYKDRKFAVVGISVDRDGEGVVRKFIEYSKINYPVIMVTRQIQSGYEKAMGKSMRSIPTTFVVDRNSRIASIHVGFTAKNQFEKEIQKLLGESSSSASSDQQSTKEAES